LQNWVPPQGTLGQPTPYNPPPYNHDRCQRLLEKIKNVYAEIQDRQEDLDIDFLKLPRTCPGDKLKPSLSRLGHVRLLNEKKAQLAALTADYCANCLHNPNNPRPVPFPVYVPDPIRLPKPCPDDVKRVAPIVITAGGIWIIIEEIAPVLIFL
jgi:hypothetical protein